MIKVEHVSKQYRLGQYGETTLRDALQRVNARFHHREDPTKQIGTIENLSNAPFFALDDVSFAVRPGRVHALMMFPLKFSMGNGWALSEEMVRENLHC